MTGTAIVALTPARGGSKSVPYKNLHPLGGKPLIAWPIETRAARRAAIDRDHRVDRRRSDCRCGGGDLAPRCTDGRPSSRPTRRSSPTRFANLWRRLRAEGETAAILVLLEATSPFRSPDVDRALPAPHGRRAARLDRDVPRSGDQSGAHMAHRWRPARAVHSRRHSVEAAAAADAGVSTERRGLRVSAPTRCPRIRRASCSGSMGAEIVPADSVIDIDTAKDFAYANAILQS